MMPETSQSPETPHAASPSDGLFSEEDTLALNANRSLRRLLINSLSPTGKVPEDKADKSMLIQLMNGMDSEIIGRARLKVAAKTDENVTNLTGLVAQALMKHKVNAPVRTGPREVTLPATIKVTNPVPGEMDQGVVRVTLEEIQNS